MMPTRLHFLLAAAAACLGLGGTPAAAQSSGQPFHVERLADGVHALVRHDPIAFVNNANSLIVVGDSGVLVVDAQFTRAATAQTIGAIRAITPLPVRYVVTTHWHDDHAGGSQVYRDSFPHVVFIAHVNTRADLATLGADNRRQTWQVGDAFLGRFERLLAAGLGVDSTPVTAAERLAMASTIAIGRQYLADAPGFRETLATLTFDERLTVHLGRRPVEIRWLGRANTRGDAVVFVPDARVVATGDLLVHPVPFAFNAFVSEWQTALDSVRATAPAAIVPGHGPVFRDLAYLDRVRGMLADIVSASRAAATRGDTLALLRRSLTLAEHRAAVTQGDPWLEKLFMRFFLDPALARAYQEARR